MTEEIEKIPTDPNEVLATAEAGMGRRMIGMGSLGLLGILLIYIAIVQSPALEWRLFLLILGVATLWMADKMRRSTGSQIELTETELRDSDGTRIALIADIDGMDRGFFAFKPSNGFLLRTKEKAENEWRPGLWWRMGRRIGVGGMTPASQTKFMSEIIAAIMAQRDLKL
ncbi:hypothetical protein [Sulfitobacter donghicola]|uniref:Uncharacterized protein n=1 Tax=Sulfitobacter donghicola DSW-25 = KCTC 12864 = JCM 14565 TaxID=1300350 RepID=A0A073IV50_9RHOB|nr:hypothetical protein [Sulfitobacter donghicola]KEJ89272.1 hypothetical protein DSW25_09605 [Sulfitobacter donghicola DSW-25 = KCTC 12864 = JCM 14565]KIN69069.1 hypothetical protein Z948_2804 [Sulfitobacter donghicola DSW-25 = KCTC 12864 = JCM 14565]